MNNNAILNAVFIFLVVDLVLRQALSRLENIAKYRADSLSNNVRPCLRMLTEICAKKKCGEAEIREIIKLVDGIKPLPAVDLIETVNFLSLRGGYEVNEPNIIKLTNKLNTVFEHEKKFVSFYCGPFSKMIMPGGFSLVFILIFFALPLVWIPIGVGYLIGRIDVGVFVCAFALAIIYEFYVRSIK